MPPQNPHNPQKPSLRRSQPRSVISAETRRNSAQIQVATRKQRGRAA